MNNRLGEGGDQGEAALNRMNTIFKVVWDSGEMALIERLKSGDFDKDEALRKAFLEWDDRERNAAEKDESPERDLIYKLKKAAMTKAAGMLAAAWEEVQDLEYYAIQLRTQQVVSGQKVVRPEVREEIIAECARLMDEMDAGV